MERVLDEVSFDASDKHGETMIIDAQYVDDKLDDLVKDQDLSHFIL
jgi:ATP-dependent HslUV protease ATP-binding subunit HslU